MSQSEGETVELVVALSGLRAALVDLRLPLALPRAQDDRTAVARLVAQLDDYLLPRVRQMGAPLLAVVGGSTGAGKSTLVSSLVGAPVSAAGVLRPTTRSPVLVHHPDDTAWFASGRVLPGLARWNAGTGDPLDAARAGVGDVRSLRLVAHESVPRGLALLDAPDIDSVVTENRELGAQLLAAADLWVFVTTGARYADAVPWDLLGEAAARRAVVAIVLDRVDAPAQQAVAAHLGAMLTERGLADAGLFTIPESTLVDGLLPPDAVAPLDRWLRGVVGDAAARERLVRHTVRGAVDDVVARAPGLAAAADEQDTHGRWLRGVVDVAYDQARQSVVAATSDGTMLRGEVLARWQEFVGTGELLRAIEAKVSTLRDRLSALLRGRPAPEPVAAAIGHGLVDVVHDAADHAAQNAYATWSGDPAGTALLDGLRLSRSSGDLRARIAEQVRAWQGAVLELVGTEGAGRRTTARALSFGVNGLGAALMVSIFASTGGLTTAEVGVAGGTAVLAQRLLEAVFGDDAVRRLTRTAHADLAGRVDALLAGEATRLTSALDALDVSPQAGAAIRAATARLAVAVTGAVGDPGPLDVRPAPAPETEPEVGAVRAWWRRLWRD